jgi:hypothetical protein
MRGTKANPNPLVPSYRCTANQPRRPLMFILKNESGETVLMKNGDPFIYTTRELARMGAKALRETKGNLTDFRFLAN